MKDGSIEQTLKANPGLKEQVDKLGQRMHEQGIENADGKVLGNERSKSVSSVLIPQDSKKPESGRDR